MSDPITPDNTADLGSQEDPVDPVHPGDSPEEEQFDAARAKAKIAKANSEATNLRKRLKELEPQLAELAKIKDANKSETEKLSERASKAEQDATSAQSELLRLRVAMRKGLTEAQARRLVGSSEEELEADADELLASFGGKQDPRPTPPAGKPKPALRGGGDPEQPVEETDPRKLAEAIRRR